MSFSFHTSAPRSEVAAAVKAAGDACFVGSEAAEDIRETIGKTGPIAQAAADAIGREGDVISVSVGGHVNKGHEPVEGWANDSLTISVSVQSGD
jgi:hypothetical protein